MEKCSLCDYNTNMEAIIGMGFTPLAQAVSVHSHYNSLSEVIQLLLDRAANIFCDAREQSTSPIDLAISLGTVGHWQFELVELFLDYIVDPETNEDLSSSLGRDINTVCSGLEMKIACAWWSCW